MNNYGICPMCFEHGVMRGVVYDDEEFMGDSFECPDCGYEWTDREDFHENGYQDPRDW